jgi:dolichol-phosphate mannosyltransferase
MKPELFVVMPAYNEAENIEMVVKQWHPVVEEIGNGSRLVIFDDGSKDQTYEILKGLERDYPCLKAITKINSGHGATCLYAYNYAIKAGAKYIFQTDSDGQTNPEEFWQFWGKKDKYDFIIGSRGKRQDGFSRVIVTKVLKILVWFIFGVIIKDSNTPFRLMKADKLKVIMNYIPADFFLSNVIISILAVKRKESYLWLPITFKERQGGINSINIKRIITIGYTAIADFYRINREIS